MPERWLGLAVAGEAVTAVEVLVPKTGKLQLQSDNTWKLQTGPRPAAYGVMYQQVADHVRENAVDRVVVKGSALSTGGTKLAHLESAELRGVVMAAAVAHTTVETLTKAKLSKTFGTRKADEYIKDDDFWDAELDGSLRAMSKEAALLLLSARKS